MGILVARLLSWKAIIWQIDKLRGYDKKFHRQIGLPCNDLHSGELTTLLQAVVVLSHDNNPLFA